MGWSTKNLAGRLKSEEARTDQRHRAIDARLKALRMKSIVRGVTGPLKDGLRTSRDYLFFGGGSLRLYVSIGMYLGFLAAAVSNGPLGWWVGGGAIIAVLCNIAVRNARRKRDRHF